MFSILLITHIIALSLSIVATIVMTIMALLSRAIPPLARKTNLVITTIGIVIGVVLLIHNPLGSRCLELSAYLIVFSLAYRFITARSIQLLAAAETIVSR